MRSFRGRIACAKNRSSLPQPVLGPFEAGGWAACSKDAFEFDALRLGEHLPLGESGSTCPDPLRYTVGMHQAKRPRRASDLTMIDPSNADSQWALPDILHVHSGGCMLLELKKCFRNRLAPHRRTNCPKQLLREPLGSLVRILLILCFQDVRRSSVSTTWSPAV